MSGKLTLVPTPIDNESMLEPTAWKELEKASERGALIAVEEARAGRRRWLHWGLPREAIENFFLYNEHTAQTASRELYESLQAGKDVFLLSDCGLPAFCDPGRLLVELCHQGGIRVTSTPFANSVALALALSGFPHERFVFEGFIPQRGPERTQVLKRALAAKDTSVLMDTPYRLGKLLEEIKAVNGEREIFLAMDLNKKEELLLRGKAKHLKAPVEKKEFVLVVGGKA